MVSLTADMRAIVHSAHLCFAATVTPDGQPNLSPKGTIRVWDDHTLFFCDIASPGTRANLRTNSYIEINVVDGLSRRGYRFFGKATYHQNDDVFELATQRVFNEDQARYPVEGVVLIHVERAAALVSPGYGNIPNESSMREINWLIDTQGRRYLDAVSSLWVTVHGHRRRELDDAVRAQLDKVAHSTLLGLGNVPSIELAERLVRVAPKGLDKVFYSDSGSTAVEVALKIAFQYWRHIGRPDKQHFVALAEGYHGDTIGSVSVGGIGLFHEIFHPLLFPVHRVPTPYWYRSETPADPEACARRCLDALDKLLREKAHEIAAFVLEPRVQGAAGMLLQPPGYLRKAAELCRQHEVLLICDEVATGFGRTGAMFASDLEGVRPDLMAVAKGLTGGYLPLAATLATNQVYDAFIAPYGQRRTFFHGHTYTGNPLACAAAIASLDIFQREGTVAAIQPHIAQLATRLAADIAPLAHVGEIRQQGLMVGIELVPDRAARSEYPFEAAIGARVCREARKHGVLLRPLGPVIVLMPPLSVTTAELDQLVAAVRRSILAITE